MKQLDRELDDGERAALKHLSARIVHAPVSAK
jgi:hypothetical protein